VDPDQPRGGIGVGESGAETGTHHAERRPGENPREPYSPPAAPEHGDDGCDGETENRHGLDHRAQSDASARTEAGGDERRPEGPGGLDDPHERPRRVRHEEPLEEAEADREQEERRTARGQ